jgi:hypothetical protein
MAGGAGDDWVLKPVFGHEARDIGIPGVTPPGELAAIRRAARRCPAARIAQRRFETPPVPTPDGPLYPCLGVYVIDGRAAGLYGRAGNRPLIDGRCRELAVLTAREGEGQSDAAGRGV